MNRHHVVTTINPATAVTCAAKGKFINPFEENLIVCKGSTVEVYAIMEDGIKTVTQFNIYGVISSMQLCPILDRSTCSLFLLTDQNCFTILTYSPKTQTMVTEATGILEETNARVTDQPIAIILDIQTNTILVSAFTGFLFSIPCTKFDVKGKGKETRVRFQPASLRTNEFDFLSMVSLKGIQQSSMAVLLGEINELKTIKTFKYWPGPNEIVEIEKLTVKVESTTHTLIAVPDPIGGVLAIGEYIISYHDLSSSGGSKELSIDLVTVTAYTFVNNSYDQCVLGDSEGYLYFLTLETSNLKVVGISSTIIAQVSLPNTIVDLGNNLLYIGSTQGDPCVVRLVHDVTTGKYKTDILHTFSNLGPIVDFCLFDYDEQGKQTIVCCSGVDRDGSLRVVENGVGFLEQFLLNIPLLTNVWTLESNNTHDTLLISTAMETILLKASHINLHEMKEYQSYSTLILNEITLATCITNNNHIIQVTSSSIRLVQQDVFGALVSEWKPPQNEKIAIAKVNVTQCVVCYGKGMLVYLEITDNKLVVKSLKQFRDIACINLSSKKENGTIYDFVLIGMWTKSKVQILQLPNLDTVLDHALQSVAGPKDILLIKLENVQYLMILLGDGQMLSYNISFNDALVGLKHTRQTMVGTYSTAMYPFFHEGEQKIFITGIRPTIITSWHQKLFFSAVNLKNVYALAPYNEMIILMTDIGLLFGQTDTSQKLHHTKIKLNDEMPIRIQYLPQSKSLAVGTVLNEKDLNNGFIKRVGKIQILDAQTFQVLDTYNLPGNEIVESMTMARFNAYPNQEFLFVGTVIESTDDPDQSLGRILVFDLKENNRCELVESIQMPGIIYNIKSFYNSVIACVNGSIYCLQRFQPDLPLGNRIEFKSNLHNNVLAFCLDTDGDRVLVGDLMQSVSLLTMTNRDPLSLKLMAIDSKPTWMTAVKFVNQNVYIGADDRNNVFTLTLDPTAIMRQTSQKNHASHFSNSGVQRLDLEGGFHVGSMINCFRQGILLDVLSNQHTTNKNETVLTTESPFTFVTVHGSIGTIKTISEEAFTFFKGIQDNILKVSNNIGNLDHSLWRSYKPKINSHNHLLQQQQQRQQQQQQQLAAESTYLDGDVLKSFHYMSKIDKQKVSESMDFKVKDIEDYINSLVS